MNAASMISARYNWRNPSTYPTTNAGSIGIVLNAWDNSDVTVAKMHSYFFRWNPWPQCGFACKGFDVGPIALTDGTLDSWNPAIDFDSSGHRRTDNSTLQYKTVFSYVLNNGTFSHDIACPTCRTSDITRYTKVQSYSYHLGEYQDIWYTSFLGFAGAATVDIGASQGDIAFYSVVP